jgi:hypothetical protein
MREANNNVSQGTWDESKIKSPAIPLSLAAMLDEDVDRKIRQDLTTDWRTEGQFYWIQYAMSKEIIKWFEDENEGKRRNIQKCL